MAAVNGRQDNFLGESCRDCWNAEDLHLRDWCCQLPWQRSQDFLEEHHRRQCGIDRLVLHDTKDLDVNIGGEVKDLNEARINVNDLVSTRKMDRASQFAVHAAHEALEDAGPANEGTR